MWLSMGLGTDGHRDNKVGRRTYLSTAGDCRAWPPKWWHTAELLKQNSAVASDVMNSHRCSSGRPAPMVGHHPMSITRRYTAHKLPSTWDLHFKPRPEGSVVGPDTGRGASAKVCKVNARDAVVRGASGWRESPLGQYKPERPSPHVHELVVSDRRTARGRSPVPGLDVVLLYVLGHLVQSQHAPHAASAAAAPHAASDAVAGR